MSATGVKRLINNAGALVVLQLVSYVLPILLIPYLTRTLGLELYGVVAFGLAIVQIGYLVTDFGFNLSATYQIAKREHNKETVRKTISAVFICKFCLLVPVFGLLFLLANLSSYSMHSHYLLLLFIPIVGQSLQPIWFFQGIERMGLITLYTLAARCSYLILAISWIKNSEDYIWLAVALGVGQVIAAILGLMTMFQLGYTPKWPTLRYTRVVFMKSLGFFWARAAVTTYTTGAVVFLGLVSTPAQVALYSAAETLYRGAQTLFQPISQALYPYMTKTRDIRLFRMLLKFAVLAALVGVTVGVLYGRESIKLIYGPGFEGSYIILVVFMFTLFLTVPSILLGYPFLAALGDSRSANVSVLYGGAFQLTLLVILYIVEFRQGYYVALSVLLAELFVLLYRFRKSICLGLFKVE